MKMPFPTESFIESYVDKKIEGTGQCPVCDEMVDVHFRQLEIKGYGVSDIVKVQWAGEILDVTVLELKNRQLKESDVSQLCRYITGLKRLLAAYRRKIPTFKYSVTGQLAGPFEVQQSDFVYLVNEMGSIEFYSLEFCLDSGFVSNPISRGWFNSGEDWKFTRETVREIFNLFPFPSEAALEFKGPKDGKG